MTRLLPALALVFLLGPAAAQDSTTRTQDLTEDEKIVHLLNRFTFGATPELVADVKKEGWSAWFDRQLKGDLEESAAYQAAVKDFETLGLSIKEIGEKYDERVGKNATEQEKREARRRAIIPMRETLAWIGVRLVHGNNHVREVMADFFRNHFTVSIEKGQVKTFVVDWERNVITRRCLGSFGDLLDATARHPAMLFYLDNCLSRRPATPEELKALESQVRRRTGSEERADEAVELAKQRGLNENYARELMELHTLGVDNGYTQDDVINVAKCLTGWTLRRRQGGGFEFDRAMHCAGDKTVFGQVIKENKANPIAEGEEVLNRLKSSQGTARYLSWKLCRWLVNDSPDEAMVARLAKVWHATGGDIPKVLRAIVDDPEFFARRNFRAKFKRPLEFVASALRATKADFKNLLHVEQALVGMSEPLYRCADPTGFYDQAEAWCDPGSLAPRWTFATDLVTSRAGSARVPASFYADLPAGKPKEWKDALVKKLLPVAGLGEATSASIDRLVDAELKTAAKVTPEKFGPRIAAMILGSPEFQKQ